MYDVTKKAIIVSLKGHSRMTSLGKRGGEGYPKLVTKSGIGGRGYMQIVTSTPKKMCISFNFPLAFGRRGSS